MEESKQNKTDLNVAQKKSSIVTYLFSTYFIPVYDSFIVVKNGAL